MSEEKVTLAVHFCSLVSRDGYPTPPIRSIGWGTNVDAMKLRVLAETEDCPPHVLQSLLILDTEEGARVETWNGEKWVPGGIELVTTYPPLFPVVNIAALAWAAGTFAKVGEATIPLFDDKGEPVNSVKEIANALHYMLYGV